MGKKNKKFKNKTKNVNLTPKSQTTHEVVDTENSADVTRVEVAADLNEDEILNEKYRYVRHDVKRLVLIIFALFIVTGIFYWLNIRTSVLDSFGNWIYKIGHFSI